MNQESRANFLIDDSKYIFTNGRIITSFHFSLCLQSTLRKYKQHYNLWRWCVCFLRTYTQFFSCPNLHSVISLISCMKVLAIKIFHTMKGFKLEVSKVGAVLMDLGKWHWKVIGLPTRNMGVKCSWGFGG